MAEKIVKDSQGLAKELVNDCINRQAAIDALGERPMVWTGSDYELGARNQYDADVLAIETVPSAQPKTHDKRTEMHACDLISRAAAIERATKDHDFYKGATTPADMARRDELLNVMCWLGELPPAQPEPMKIDLSRCSEENWERFKKEWANTPITAITAEPERIKGHWIEIASSNHTYKCSVCGRLLVNITDGKNNVAKNYPYCHCGADMRGEQE